MAIYTTRNLVNDYITGYTGNNFLTTDWAIIDFEKHIRRACHLIEAALGQSFTVYDTTPIMAATTAASNMFGSVTSNPATARRLGVLVSAGTAGSGTVVLTGTLDNLAGLSETITYGGNSLEFTLGSIHTLSALTTTGLADEAAKPNISIYRLAAPNIIIELATMYAAMLIFQTLDAGTRGSKTGGSIYDDVKALLEGIKSGDVSIIGQDGVEILLDSRTGMYGATTTDETGADITADFSKSRDILDGPAGQKVSELD